MILEKEVQKRRSFLLERDGLILEMEVQEKEKLSTIERERELD